MMPILPFLTDSRAHLETALADIKEAGGTSIVYTALHLRPGAKEWFFEWLEQEHPELVRRYRLMYGSGASAPKDYRRWLAAKITPDHPSARSRAPVRDRASRTARARSPRCGRARCGPRVESATTSLIEAAMPPDVQPTLF